MVSVIKISMVLDDAQSYQKIEQGMGDSERGVLLEC